MNHSKAYDLVLISLLSALTYLFTRFINIQPPFALNGGGLIHIGNVMIVVSSIVFGKKHGAASAALGMGIFDLTSGYAIWAPFTILIRGAMGYTLGYISHMKNNGNNIFYNVIAVIVSGILMIVGYYFAQVIIYGNWVTPIASIPGDITQVVVGLVLGLPLAAIVKKIYRKPSAS